MVLGGGLFSCNDLGLLLGTGTGMGVFRAGYIHFNFLSCHGQVVDGCIYSGVAGCGGRFEAGITGLLFFWLAAMYHQYFGTSSTLDSASPWALGRGVTLRGIIYMGTFG